MAYTLQQTINFASAFIQYSPLVAGTGSEPAISIASIIKNSILSAPLCWSFNRFEDSSLQTAVGVQDYTIALTNFGFLEKVSLTDSKGGTQEIKDIYNTNALSKSAIQQRPSAVSVISYTPGVSVRLRFLGVPEQAYTVNLTYQGLAVQFGPFVVNSAANAVGGNTAYTGIFSPLSFPVGSPATIAGFSSANVYSTVSSVSTAVSGNTTYTGVFNILSFPVGSSATIVGFTNPSNNGVFVVVSVTGTTLVLANAFGLAETALTTTSATASGVIVSMNNGTFLVVRRRSSWPMLTAFLRFRRLSLAPRLMVVGLRLLIVFRIFSIIYSYLRRIKLSVKTPTPHDIVSVASPPFFRRQKA